MPRVESDICPTRPTPKEFLAEKREPGQVNKYPE